PADIETSGFDGSKTRGKAGGEAVAELGRFEAREGRVVEEEGRRSRLPSACPGHRSVGIVNAPTIGGTMHRGIREIAAAQYRRGAVVYQCVGLTLEEEVQIQVAITNVGGEAAYIFRDVGVGDAEHIPGVDDPVLVQIHYPDVPHLGPSTVRVGVQFLLSAEDSVRFVVETRPHRLAGLTLIRLGLRDLVHEDDLAAGEGNIAGDAI